MNELTTEDIAGEKAGGQMSPEMRLVIDTQKALLKARQAGDVELVFAEVEKKMGSGIRLVDRIGLMMQTLFMLEDQDDVYNNAVDFFVKIMKVAKSG